MLKLNSAAELQVELGACSSCKETGRLFKFPKLLRGVVLFAALQVIYWAESKLWAGGKSWPARTEWAERECSVNDLKILKAFSLRYFLLSSLIKLCLCCKGVSVIFQKFRVEIKPGWTSTSKPWLSQEVSVALRKHILLLKPWQIFLIF